MLDIGTLVAVLSATSLLAAMGIGMLWLVHGRYPGIGHWAAGGFCIFAGGLVIVARLILPELLTLVTGNALIISGYALALHGVNAFTRQPHQLRLEVATVAAVTVGQAVLLLTAAPLASRVILLSAGWIVLSAAMATRFLAYGRREPAMASVSLLGALLMIAHILVTGTLAVLAAFTEPQPSMLAPNPLRAATYFEANLVVTLLAMTLILLVTRRLEVDLGRLAAFDELTGCLTRRAFLAECGREMARIERSGGACAIVMFDADHFKTINDDHGHHVGDAVLAELARRVGNGLRQQDCLGRYGGEEFCALLVETGAAEAAAVADRLRRMVAETPVAVGDLQVRVTISLGVAAAPEHAGEIAGLLKAADGALYRAKHGGRNRAELAPPVAA